MKASKVWHHPPARASSSIVVAFIGLDNEMDGFLARHDPDSGLKEQRKPWRGSTGIGKAAVLWPFFASEQFFERH